jgi:hypothetical protein
VHVAPGVLVGTVVDGLVRREVGPGLGTEPALVGVQPALAGDVLGHDPVHSLAIRHGDVERADGAAALDQRGDGFQSFRTALRTLARVEAMAMLAKGQVRVVPANDLPAQRAFVHQVFGVAT